ncbi:MAG: hypothetical protein E7643_08230 [Ruminococcaceae bacterium]|nr:hypothetical protein [Oscillospiraceae bacterium]
MTKNRNTAAIALGVAGAAAMLGGAAVAVHNSKRMRTLRAVHRTNAILRRVGMLLTRMSAAAEECI